MYARHSFGATVSTPGTITALVSTAITGNPLTGAALTSFLSDITGLFQGSSYDATHQALLQWASAVAANPNAAANIANLVRGNDASGTMNGGTGANAPPANALTAIACWAGYQVAVPYLEEMGGIVTQGCGCEVDHGCRADAQTILQSLLAQFPQLASNPVVSGIASNAPVPTPSAGTAVTPGTPIIQTQVPNSTLQVGGIPLNLLLLGGGAVLLFALSALPNRTRH